MSNEACPTPKDALNEFKALRRLKGQYVSGVEVFGFHWGCTRLGPCRDDQRGPTACARGGTDSLLPLLDNFLGNSRADLFLGMSRCVPPGMKSPRHTGN